MFSVLEGRVRISLFVMIAVMPHVCPWGPASAVQLALVCLAQWPRARLWAKRGNIKILKQIYKDLIYPWSTRKGIVHGVCAKPRSRYTCVASESALGVRFRSYCINRATCMCVSLGRIKFKILGEWFRKVCQPRSLYCLLRKGFWAFALALMPVKLHQWLES